MKILDQVSRPHTLLDLLAESAGSFPAQLYILSGPSGAGKTSWCLELARQAAVNGHAIAGLVSPAVFEGGVKVGIDLLDLFTQQRRRLANRRKKMVGEPAGKNWQFEPGVLFWGNNLLEAIPANHLLILDELGPLELCENGGLTNALELLSARKYKLACAVVRPALLTNALERWPWAKTFIVDGERP